MRTSTIPTAILLLACAVATVISLSGCANEASTDSSIPQIPTADAASTDGVTSELNGTEENSDGTVVGSRSPESSDGTIANEPAAESLIIDEPGVDRPTGMVWVPGGKFKMGGSDGFPDELPVHEVELDGFWMDSTEVTVAEFKRFADATGYVTVAERKPKREDFADQLSPEQIAAIPEEVLVPGSICFNPDFDRQTFPEGRRPTPSRKMAARLAGASRTSQDLRASALLCFWIPRSRRDS